MVCPLSRPHRASAGQGLRPTDRRRALPDDRRVGEARRVLCRSRPRPADHGGVDRPVARRAGAPEALDPGALRRDRAPSHLADLGHGQVGRRLPCRGAAVGDTAGGSRGAGHGAQGPPRALADPRPGRTRRPAREEPRRRHQAAPGCRPGTALPDPPAGRPARDGVRPAAGGQQAPAAQRARERHLPTGGPLPRLHRRPVRRAGGAEGGTAGPRPPSRGHRGVRHHRPPRRPGVGLPEGPHPAGGARSGLPRRAAEHARRGQERRRAGLQRRARRRSAPGDGVPAGRLRRGRGVHWAGGAAPARAAAHGGVAGDRGGCGREGRPADARPRVGRDDARPVRAPFRRPSRPGGGGDGGRTSSCRVPDVYPRGPDRRSSGPGETKSPG
ncbi:hypothetical protein SAMN05660657_05009 [Geodermatophilus amargosae]|uniref:Uncharacterized protein n=1 Tax=Geodermatophilus amargosae TaxID=1296565 RepID=A0A1I7CXG5_9ACTN|nr:hypothetical protein SAMN05660657_05009 [Geodermatophilus amargosae]